MAAARRSGRRGRRPRRRRVIAAQDVGRAGFFTRLWRTVWGGLAGAIGGALQWLWSGIRSLLGLAG